MIEQFGVSIIELLYSSSLLLLVGTGSDPNFSQRKLTVWSTENNSVLCETSFMYKIEAVLANKAKTIAYVKDKIHIYNTTNMKLAHSININYMQSKIGLAPSSENCYLAYTDSGTEGIVNIFDANLLSLVKTVAAHKSCVARIALNFDGTLLATCSEKVAAGISV
eukprot:TRINITY_DN892_c0_g2_i2.p1 TRINITY_DN892_c0_g2~~TRINITY_DN892_c0_g2_i2.p1  ORF type:complete len:165 (-),score=44.15 TRINITY_DN892_c0_g2_i2:537-1031(-)